MIKENYWSYQRKCNEFLMRILSSNPNSSKSRFRTGSFLQENGGIGKAGRDEDSIWVQGVLQGQLSHLFCKSRWWVLFYQVFFVFTCSNWKEVENRGKKDSETEHLVIGHERDLILGIWKTKLGRKNSVQITHQYLYQYLHHWSIDQKILLDVPLCILTNHQCYNL